MKDREKLLRDIETLLEAVRLDWRDIESKHLTQEEKTGIKKHIRWCLDELKILHKKLD